MSYMPGFGSREDVICRLVERARERGMLLVVHPHDSLAHALASARAAWLIRPLSLLA